MDATQPLPLLFSPIVEAVLTGAFIVAVLCCIAILVWVTGTLIRTGHTEDIVLPPRRRPRRNHGQWDYWETTRIEYYPVSDSTTDSTPPSSDPKADPKPLRIVK